MKTQKQTLILGLAIIVAALIATPASFARESPREYNPPIFREITTETTKAEEPSQTEKPALVIAKPREAKLM